MISEKQFDFFKVVSYMGDKSCHFTELSDAVFTIEKLGKKYRFTRKDDGTVEIVRESDEWKFVAEKAVDLIDFHEAEFML